MEELIPEDSSTHAGSSIVGSVIPTIAAVIASYPATVFLLQYTVDPQNTGAFVAGGIFAVLAFILWIAALWSSSQVLKPEGSDRKRPHRLAARALNSTPHDRPCCPFHRSFSNISSKKRGQQFSCELQKIK